MAEQLSLIPTAAHPWRLTDTQRRIGRQGITNARAALAATQQATPTEGRRTA